VQPEETARELKGIWPIYDKNQAREFKRKAHEALQELERRGSLPANTVRLSHLQTSSGERFVQMVFHLAVHAMQVVLARDHGAPAAPAPVVAKEDAAVLMGPAVRALQARTVYEAERHHALARANEAAHGRWKELGVSLADDLSRAQGEARAVAREIAEAVAGAEKEWFTEVAALERTPVVDAVRAVWARVDEAAADLLPNEEFLMDAIRGQLQFPQLPAETSGADLTQLTRRWAREAAAFSGAVAEVSSRGQVAERAELAAEGVARHREAYEAHLVALRDVAEAVRGQLTDLAAKTARLRAEIESGWAAAGQPEGAALVPPTPARAPLDFSAVAGAAGKTPAGIPRFTGSAGQTPLALSKLSRSVRKAAGARVADHSSSQDRTAPPQEEEEEEEEEEAEQEPSRLASPQRYPATYSPLPPPSRPAYDPSSFSPLVTLPTPLGVPEPDLLEQGIAVPPSPPDARRLTFSRITPSPSSSLSPAKPRRVLPRESLGTPPVSALDSLAQRVADDVIAGRRGARLVVDDEVILGGNRGDAGAGDLSHGYPTPDYDLANAPTPVAKRNPTMISDSPLISLATPKQRATRF
jgi:hypothetical protein